jgi:hypothetical protein
MNIFKKILQSGLIILLFIFATACNQHNNETNSNTFSNSNLNPAAPPETEILGQLAGMWNAEQTILNRDGAWGEPKYSKWKWYYILDGQAIQDDWIALDSLNNEQVIGTNICIFNPEENKWHMAWIDKTNRRLAAFTARNKEATVIMDGTNAQGRHIRNTFFNILENEFDWNQEWTFDDGNSWVIVTKIHAVRVH